MVPVTKDVSVRKNMIVLALVSLIGMIALMGGIIWQMQGNIIEERKRLIQSQVQSAVGMIREMTNYKRQQGVPDAEIQENIIPHIAAMKYLHDGYFFIFDEAGMVIMHPYSTELLGKSMITLRDSHGQYFVKNMLKVARAGGGFVTYDWPRPGGDKPIAKLSYVAEFKPFRWVIGSGLYTDDLSLEAARQIGLSVVVIFGIFGIIVAISLSMSERFMHAYRDSAIIDMLTGLHTRRYLDEVGVRMMNRSGWAVEEPLAAIFMDIDHFKHVNDTYGHKVGDIVLRTIGTIMQRCLRPGELAFRYGGEELVVLLHASESNCYAIAERIRAAIHAHVFNADGQAFQITVSAGVSLSQPGDALSDLLRRADKCMYAAKEQGRDRTVTETGLMQVAIEDSLSDD